MIYTPSEMVGTERRGVRGIESREARTICTSHVERLNGNQRLFLKRLNRLTYCFSRKIENPKAAFAVFAAVSTTSAGRPALRGPAASCGRALP